MLGAWLSEAPDAEAPTVALAADALGDLASGASALAAVTAITTERIIPRLLSLLERHNDPRCQLAVICATDALTRCGSRWQHCIPSIDAGALMGYELLRCTCVYCNSLFMIFVIALNSCNCVYMFEQIGLIKTRFDIVECAALSGRRILSGPQSATRCTFSSTWFSQRPLISQLRQPVSWATLAPTTVRRVLCRHVSCVTHVTHTRTFCVWSWSRDAY